MSDTPLSGASLGLDQSTDGQTAIGAFETSETDRYQDGGMLGRGGMGEVRAAHDRRLARTVAIKTAALGGRAADALVLEAQLTARLEHPGIVPIYGAGEYADGSPYYTMPVVRGRSLSDAIQQAADLPARLRLVGQFVHACQAVAYAHSQGVLHRDLKPSNVMVGEFGETLVVDWGLAVSAEVGRRGVSAAGTPEYCAPEQRSGGPIDVRADVFSLGATLYELLSGRRPSTDDAAPLTALTPGAPPELAAVVSKATGQLPDERYADVPALIADVEAWFEGRRVAAYDYSAFELLRRFVTAWRTPLLLVLLGVTATAAAVTVGFRSTAAERDRARQAESAAVSERERSESHLARALIAQAVEAAADGRRAEAELLAVQALAYRESAEARGVLARSWAHERPTLLRRSPQPPCALVLDDFGDQWLCRDGAELSWRTLGPDGVVQVKATLEREVGSAAVVDDSVLFAGPGLSIGRWDGVTVAESRLVAKTFFIKRGEQTGGPSVLHGNSSVFAVRQGTVKGVPVLGCPTESSFVDLDLWGDQGLYLCRNGDLFTGPIWGSERQRVSTMALADGVPVRVAAAQDGSRRAAATGTTGMIHIVDGDHPERSFGFHSGLDVLGGHALLYGDQLALLSPEHGVRLYDIRSGTLLAELPGRHRAARWVGAGVLRTFERDAVEDWAVPTIRRPHRLPFESGVAAVSVDSRGELVASAHGHGQIRVHSLSTGALVTQQRPHLRVMKDVAFAPDRLVLLAVPTARSEAFMLRPPDWEPVSIPTPSTQRRVVWVSPTEALTASYGPDLTLLDMSGAGSPARELGLPDRFVDIDRHEGLGGAVLGTEGGGFFTLTGLSELLMIGEDVSARGIAAGGGTIAALTSRAVRLWRADGTRELSWEGPENQDLAVSADGDTVAVGLVDGTVFVYDAVSGDRLALLRGHTARVSGLAFTPDDSWLVTGSWDGDVRVWSMDALRRDPSDLAAVLERSWGRDGESMLPP